MAVKTRKCLYFGKEISLTATEDLCCRKQNSRSSRVYTVYRSEEGNKFVRIHQGNSTCVLVKTTSGKVNSSFIYAEKDSIIWRKFSKEIKRKEKNEITN